MLPRSVLSVSLILAVALASSRRGARAEETGEPGHWRVYIGTYTGGASEGIYTVDLDTAAGRLGEPRLACKTENPSFLAMHPEKAVLYAVGEMSTGSQQRGGTVSAFKVERETGQLTLLNRQSTRGAGPCHVTVAPSGRHVATANYTGGSVTLLPVLEDGRLGEACSFVHHEGRSVNPARQEGPHAHSVNFGPSGQFLYTDDLGLDQVLVYRYDADTGTVKPNDPPFAALAPGAGPRHLAIHPNGRFLYVADELNSTVTAFKLDDAAGRLELLQAVGTLPPEFQGENFPAEIQVHSTGRFLYASNRGHDSIATFVVDPATGRLTTVGTTTSCGSVPRSFSLDPMGRFLLVANQKGNNLVVFRVNGETGLPEPTGQAVAIPSPVCVLFSRR